MQRFSFNDKIDFADSMLLLLISIRNHTAIFVILKGSQQGYFLKRLRLKRNIKGIITQNLCFLPRMTRITQIV